MLVSLFARLSAVQPVTRITTWEAFVRDLRHEHDYKNKESVPLFSPAEFRGNRSKASVQRVHFGVLDLDHIALPRVEQVSAMLERTPYAFALYTTWSHTEEELCARVCVLFSRPVEAAEWKAFWPNFNAAFGSFADDKCADSPHFYFAPAAPAERAHLALSFFRDGRPLDVDALLGKAPAPRQVTTRAEWARALPQTLQKSASALLKGEPYGRPGERDDVTFKLVAFLVEAFPHETAEELASTFEASLKEMAVAADGAPTLDDVRAKITRHFETVGQQTQQHNDAQEQAVSLAIAGRTHPYTEDELTSFGSISRRWILQHGRAHYFFLLGDYVGPFLFDAEAVAPALLSPAATAGLSLQTTTRLGAVRPKTLKELVAEYGQVAYRVELDMTVQKTSYNKHVLTLATSPERELEPEYNEQIDEWLGVLGAESAEKLRDWVACLTRLNEPCSALYLNGAKGVGKTMFAVGLARLWADRPTTLDEAMADFNASMVSCPLVFADERLPRDFRGRMHTDRLREFIQARTRTINRKFHDVVELRGCVRVVMAANNMDLLQTSENLTVNDINAIADRILYVQCGEAEKYLAQVPRTTKNGWVEGFGIARYALWLAKNRKVETSHRFLVVGETSRLHRSLTTSSGIRSAVCNWLVAYILEPQKFDSNRSQLVRRTEDGLCVNAQGIARYWDLYETNVEAPPAGIVAKALAGLSRERVQRRVGRDQRKWYHVIDTENLAAWAEETGYAEAGEVRKLVFGPPASELAVAT